MEEAQEVKVSIIGPKCSICSIPTTRQFYYNLLFTSGYLCPECAKLLYTGCKLIPQYTQLISQKLRG